MDEIRAIVQEWLDKQNHDRCWYYPDLFRHLAEILNITPTIQPSLPPRDEFEKGCSKYQNEEYGEKIVKHIADEPVFINNLTAAFANALNQLDRLPGEFEEGDTFFGFQFNGDCFEYIGPDGLAVANIEYDYRLGFWEAK